MATQGKGHNTLSATDAGRLDDLTVKKGQGSGLTTGELDELKQLKEKEIHSGS